MPGFTVTRGLGPNATPTNLIARGFLPRVAAEVVRILKKGRSATKKFIRELEESFKISAMLMAHNGKELVKPILNTVNATSLGEAFFKVNVIPKKIIARKANDLIVEVNTVKVRNNNEHD